MAMSPQENPHSASQSAPTFGAPFLMTPFMRENLRELRDNWVFFVLLGAALMILGGVALSHAVLATITTAFIFGYYFVGAGIFYIVGAVFTRAWGGFFLSLLAGVLHLAVGVIVLNHPEEALLLYTLLLAVFFFVEGLFRIFAALSGQFKHWGWVLLSGVVPLLLGISIWRQWPFSGLYVIGLFLGINLLVSGASYLSLGLRLRNAPV